MRKPQVSLLTVSVSIATLLLASTTSFANHHGKHHDGNYKGENYKGEAMPAPCPVELMLKDGFYIGAAAGYESYRVVDDVNTALISPTLATPAVSLDPRLAANGAVGGGFIGYGKYFDNFYANYSGYLGLEIFGNWSGAQTDYELNLLSAGITDVYTTDIEVKSNYGISLLPGFKINNATLFYVRLGYNWSRVDVDETYNNVITATTSVPFSSSDNQTVHGFNYGLGLESTFFDNWSLRTEYTHTGYNSFTTGFQTGVKASDNQFMLGLIYHFVI